MNISEKIEALLSYCKEGSFSITVNECFNCYRTVEEEIEHLVDLENMGAETPQEVRDGMIARSRMIEVRAYPNPVGFNNAYHYDLESALDNVYEQVKSVLDYPHRKEDA